MCVCVCQDLPVQTSGEDETALPGQRSRQHLKEQQKTPPDLLVRLAPSETCGF